jgi:hypothetical protein
MTAVGGFRAALPDARLSSRPSRRREPGSSVRAVTKEGWIPGLPAVARDDSRRPSPRLRIAGIEALLQVAPALDIALLQGWRLRGEGRDALGEAALEHECHGVGELARPEFHGRMVVIGFRIGAMRQHGVVQARPARHEAMRLGVILAVDKPHELRHDIHVIPGRAEGVLAHHPAIRKDHEIDVRGAGFARG